MRNVVCVYCLLSYTDVDIILHVKWKKMGLDPYDQLQIMDDLRRQ